MDKPEWLFSESCHEMPTIGWHMEGEEREICNCSAVCRQHSDSKSISLENIWLRFKCNEMKQSKLLAPTDNGVVIVDLHPASMALNGNYIRLKILVLSTCTSTLTLLLYFKTYLPASSYFHLISSTNMWNIFLNISFLTTKVQSWKSEQNPELTQ